MANDGLMNSGAASPLRRTAPRTAKGKRDTIKENAPIPMCGNERAVSRVSNHLRAPAFAVVAPRGSESRLPTNHHRRYLSPPSGPWRLDASDRLPVKKGGGHPSVARAASLSRARLGCERRATYLVVRANPEKTQRSPRDVAQRCRLEVSPRDPRETRHADMFDEDILRLEAGHHLEAQAHRRPQMPTHTNATHDVPIHLEARPETHSLHGIERHS